MLPTAAPQDSFVVVSLNDPAIDQDSADGFDAIVKYAMERDASVLHLRPGGELTKFHCKPLVGEARTWVLREPDAVARCVRAFKACVTSITGLEMPDHSQWNPGAPVRATFGDMLSDDAVKKLSLVGLDMVIQEVGSVCYQLANLTPGQKKALSLPPGYVVSVSEKSSAATSTTTTEPTHPGSS